jgi:Ser/Thr protein kinase RdoA (MazF antagonist)
VSATLPDGAAVSLIVSACGLVPGRVVPLAEGVTAVAWRVETQDGPVVVRVAPPERSGSTRDASAQFEAQAAVLQRLADPRVPRHIATDRSVEHDPLDGRWRWSVDTFAAGVPFQEAGSPADAARDLGSLLAKLHTLPADGFGMLEDRQDVLRGCAADMETGLLSRWPVFWPFDGTPLIAHPVSRLAPQLLGAIARLRDPLLRYLDVPMRAVCHGDLHGGHILVEEGRLSALIDFGDAFVANPAWDLASFAHHNGWALTEALLEGYEPKRLLREVRLAEAQQLAVALALQKLVKWRERDPQRLERILGFLEDRG